MNDSSPLTLDEAAEICLRGKVKAATLRAAASRGELKVMKLGRRIMVTPAAVREWMELCQEKVRVQGFGLGQQTASKPLYGLSETDQAFTVALAAAKARVTVQSGSLRNISEESTTLPSGAVVSIKSQSQT